MSRRAALLSTVVAAAALWAAAPASADTVRASADTTIEQGAPQRNLWGAATLQAATADGARLALLRFPAVPVAASAVTLRVHAPAAVVSPIKVLPTTCGSWTATGVTWDSRPVLGAPIGRAGGVQAGWNDIALDPSVYGEDDGSFCVALTASGPEPLTIDSVEGPGDDGALLVTTLAPAGRVTWRADFESGSLGPGGQLPCIVQQLSGCAVVSAPVNQGSYAGRFTVRPSGALESQRAEVITEPPPGTDTQGSDVYYAWATLFPQGFTTPSWANFMQINSQFAGFPGNLMFHMFASYSGPRGPANEVDLQLSGGDITNGPVPMHSFIVQHGLHVGSWNEYVVHFRRSWGDDGLTEVWHRVRSQDMWRKVVTYHGANLWHRAGVDGDASVEFGYYRSGIGDPPASTIYADGLVQATSFEAAAATAFPNG